MNVLHVRPNFMFLNVFPRKSAPYYFIYPSTTPEFFHDSSFTPKIYCRAIIAATTDLCIETTATTWDEARQLHPELFI